ncbi:hypothetical protein L202_06993 [Cryptococcus amylolentus CBS 6039]|uniref:Oxidation resistance protein 1 n=1 Tax=Cryptococcus amylolentus CBS 6039 TaxID=1295533 RepID=A0A1E3HE91_9TREE|nr:hypothetical protein L202_06993 [Cryptococcus amylolentus CBS 6039]ODN74653.1 hypothetical protein L202_06993 [Cryptococcus amylolentus CBS 6039]
MTFPEPAHAPSSPGNSHKSHATSSSADFGAFTSAAPATPHSVHHLGEADLLGSYEDDQHVAKPQRGQPPPSPGAWPSAFDPLATGSTEIPPDPPHLPTNPIDRHSVSPPATYISLPPRPTEISPNYVPHARTRRLSSFAVATSPTSPPIFTDTGDETVFHPAHQSSGNTALGSIQKVQRKSSTSPTSSRVRKEPSYDLTNNHAGQTSHSTLFNTLATTTKLASRWKSALAPQVHSPTSDMSGYHPRGHHEVPTHQTSPPPLPVPIDITHKTPFASAEQLAHSYVAPTGAPGFIGQHNSSVQDIKPREYRGRVVLKGRRDSTDEVLSVPMADSLQHHLPPRQRLINEWSLLFSMEQHGASLSTLYGLVEKNTQKHPNMANILIVQGEDNVFGVYMNEPIVRHEGSYFGSGESFLFKVDGNRHVSPYKWTGKNQYFALCESNFISFGGGAGCYGLILDSTFLHNSSATCPAYDNDILCQLQQSKTSSAVPFQCFGLEVWSIG